jgi:hypothetical protein
MWRLIAASSRGTSHARSGLPCQDAYGCEVIAGPGGEPVLVAVLSDGAGSAGRAEVASRLACRRMLDEIARLLGSFGALDAFDRQAAVDCLDALRCDLLALAEEEGNLLREYACTLLVAIVGPARAVFFQIGDGAIVAEAEGSYRCIFWPAKGEYENTTFFVTDANAADRLEFEQHGGALDALSMFSDGLERVALNVGERTVHAPFFRSMFAVLAATPQEAMDLLRERLENFLASPEMAARTDDDATLILALRSPECRTP